MSKTSTKKESNIVNFKTSNKINISDIDLSMNINVPQMIIKSNKIFNDRVYDEIFSYYFKNGTYFKERLSWHETGTKLYIDLAKIINKISPANDADALSKNSVMLIAQLKSDFLTEFVKKLPGWLANLQWKCKEIKFSVYNPSQFCGINYDTGKPMYGVPAFMLILYIDPISSDCVPIYKVKIDAPIKFNMVDDPNSYRNALVKKSISNKSDILEDKSEALSDTRSETPTNAELEASLIAIVDESVQVSEPVRKFVKGRWI